MDVVISVVIGVVALVVAAAWALTSLGVGSSFIEPVTGALGIRLSRRINAVRRRRSLRKLPPDIPPPPPSP
jgi:hypothetical protein